jgi:hypothetical protein
MVDSEGYVHSLSVVRFPVDTRAMSAGADIQRLYYIHTTSLRVERRPITIMEMVGRFRILIVDENRFSCEYNCNSTTSDWAAYDFWFKVMKSTAFWYMMQCMW